MGSPGANPALRRAPALGVVLAVASLCAAMAFIDATVVNIAFPSIERSFPRSSSGAISWVLNAYNIVFAAFLVAAGRVGDVFGRRRVLVAGLVTFVLASALCSQASSVAELVAFRLLQALGGAMLVPCALAVVLDAFPLARRNRAVSVFTAVSALAAGIGPAVGGALISLSNWRLVFLLNVPVGVLAIVLVRRVIVESRAPGRRRLPDLLGALVFAAAVAALVLAIVRGQQWGWVGVRTLAAVVVALALGAAAARRAARHPVPILDLDLIRVRAVGVIDAGTLLAAAGYYGYTLVNVLFLTGVWHYSILDAGLGITPGPFVAIAVAGPASRLAERLGPRPVLIGGGLFWAAGVAWFAARTGLPPDYLGRWLPGMVLVGVGAGTFFPLGSSVAVSQAPEDGYATATSLNAVARQVGAAFGVAAVVAIIGRPTPAGVLQAFHGAWLFAVFALVGAATVAFGLGRLRLPSARETEAEQPSVGGQQSPKSPVPALSLVSPAPRITANPGVPETVADFLGRAPIFAALGEDALERLGQASRRVHLEVGEWLFHEGDDGDALYVVTAGRLEVLAGDGGGDPIAVVGRGGVVGEYALLTSERRSASVRAARAADLIAIERVAFDRVLLAHPEIAYALVRQLASALRANTAADRAPRALPVTVALVALDERVPLAKLADGLRRALASHARVVTLEPPPSDRAVDRESAPAIYGPVLDRAVVGNDLVLLPVAHPWTHDAWSAFAVQQADRMLVVSSGLAPRDPETLVALRGCDLVAWDIAPGSGLLDPWSDALEPLETHRWSQGVELERDLARSARRLTGRSVGIVLGGGGARAFAHIGVLEELAAAGVVIDRVGSVSMGAYIGGLLAMGCSPEEIDARCYEECVRRNPLGDYTIPRHALLRGRRGEEMVHRAFGSVSIAELPLSFFCVAADLRRGERVVHRNGSLTAAVATSIALPVMIPPRLYRGRLQVDGAIVDNVPVGPMADLGEGPIIAVDIRAGSADGAERASANGRERLPPLTETLMRVMFFGNKLAGSDLREGVDVLIRPRSNGVGFLEFHQIDRAREAGRAAAREALAALGGAEPLRAGRSSG